MEIDTSKLSLNQRAGIMTAVLGIILGIALQGYMITFFFICLAVGMASVSLEESGISETYLKWVTLATIASGLLFAGYAFGKFAFIIFN